jgi:DNA helicase-2/ATP-dependent DNA helicase PcrA
MDSSQPRIEAILSDLNEPQRRAVTHREGPLLVVAGPGSGKTRVITRRAAYLVHSGTPARNILAITFTNKAADEMRRRIEALGIHRGMWVYTFHALGARLLREFGSLAGVQPNFSIYDETDRLRVVKEALEACGVEAKVLSPERARALISDAKGRLETPEQYEAQAECHEERTLARVYEAYDELLEQRNAVDFDDLIMRVALVLDGHPEIAERLNVRFRHVLIDEYQDTNHAQYLIAQHLAMHHHNICATGDPDQSIYAWRGADIRNILEFERDFSNATVVRLEQNYRSTRCILRVADRLILNNRRRKPKELWTENPEGEPVRVWEFGEGREEAEQVAATIAQQHAAGRGWSDFAIFYRINALSRGLEESLRARGIPYRIARGVEFYNRKEIRDVLAYLRVLVNPADQVALLRIINTPARGIGQTTIERLRARADQTGQPLSEVLRNVEEVPDLQSAAKRVRGFVELLNELQPALKMRVSKAVSHVLARSGLEEQFRKEHEAGGEDRLANVQELVTAAARYEQEYPGASLPEFLNRVSLVSDQDSVDENAGCVLLMTLHAAKGLEFPVVFMVGLEQGLLPHETALHERRDVEEERRLCFVGITRARERLFISRAQERLIRGRPMPRPGSQFLGELDDGSLVWEDFRSGSGTRPALGPQDGFVPLVEDLPPEEAARLVPKRRLGQPPELDDDGYLAPDDARPVRRPGHRPDRSEHSTSSAAYADWKPGTLVEHDLYGVGQVLWIQLSPGQTRAGLRFAGYGEKTFILECSPVRKLERRPP